MGLEDLIICLVQALSDHGNLDVYITTENENQLYSEATVTVLNDLNGRLFVKLEGVKDTDDVLDDMNII